MEEKRYIYMYIWMILVSWLHYAINSRSFIYVTCQALVYLVKYLDSYVGESYPIDVQKRVEEAVLSAVRSPVHAYNDRLKLYETLSKQQFGSTDLGTSMFTQHMYLRSYICYFLWTSMTFIKYLQENSWSCYVFYALILYKPTRNLLQRMPRYLQMYVVKLEKYFLSYFFQYIYLRNLFLSISY